VTVRFKNRIFSTLLIHEARAENRGFYNKINSDQINSVQNKRGWSPRPLCSSLFSCFLSWWLQRGFIYSMMGICIVLAFRLQYQNLVCMQRSVSMHA